MIAALALAMKRYAPPGERRKRSLGSIAFTGDTIMTGTSDIIASMDRVAS